MTLERINAEEDPNWIAYREYRAAVAPNVQPGTFVAFCEGQFIAAGSKDELLKELKDRDLIGKTKNVLLQEIGTEDIED